MPAAVVKDGTVTPKFRQGKISPPFLTAKFSPRNSPLAKFSPPLYAFSLPDFCLAVQQHLLELSGSSGILTLHPRLWRMRSTRFECQRVHILQTSQVSSQPKRKFVSQAKTSTA